jgi:hypothetical protein
VPEEVGPDHRVKIPTRVGQKYGIILHFGIAVLTFGSLNLGQALVRDDFKCLVTGRWEWGYSKFIDPDAKGPAEITEMCHIAPQSFIAMPASDNPAHDEPKAYQKVWLQFTCSSHPSD